MGCSPPELRTATQAQQTSGPTHTGINQHPHRPPLPREEPVSQDSTHNHEDRSNDAELKRRCRECAVLLLRHFPPQS